MKQVNDAPSFTPGPCGDTSYRFAKKQVSTEIEIIAFWNKTRVLKANMLIICISRHATWELLKCKLVLLTYKLFFIELLVKLYKY